MNPTTSYLNQRADNNLGKPRIRRVVYCAGRDGLGNRMLTLEKACRYAFEFGMEVVIDWSDDVFQLDRQEFLSFFTLSNVKNCADFDFYAFENPYPNVVSAFNAAALPHLVVDSPDARHHWAMIQFWKRYAEYRRCFRYRKNRRYAFRNGEHLGLLATKHDALLYYCSVPENEPERFRHISFSKEMVRQIGIKFPDLKSHADIGIHIRHTDKASQNLHWAYAAIEKSIAEFQGRPIVHLATDNDIVVNEFLRRFGGSAEIQKLPLHRGSDPMHLREGSKESKHQILFEGMADMWFLANSSHILFQASSSFSRVALALSSPNQTCIAWDFLNEN
jgi:hypothetical protein